MNFQNVNTETIREVFLSNLENDFNEFNERHETLSSEYVAPWQVYEEPKKKLAYD